MQAGLYEWKYARIVAFVSWLQAEAAEMSFVSKSLLVTYEDRSR